MLKHFFILLLLTNIITNIAYAVPDNNQLISLVNIGEHSQIVDFLNDPKNQNKINSFDINGITSPLIEATLNNDIHIVQILLEHAANPNIQNIGGATPLHISARRGYNEIASLLLNKGANPNIKDHDGCTPLMRAISNKNLPIIDKLLKEGKADLNITNSKGERAISYAIKVGNSKIMKKIFVCDENLRRDGQYLIQLISNRTSAFREEISPIILNCPYLANHMIKMHHTTSEE